MEQFPLSVVNDHLLAEIGGRTVLLDTGVPASFGGGEVTLLGETFPLRLGWLGIELAEIAAVVGAPLDALLGFDLLHRFRFLIDRPEGRVSFFHGPLEGAGVKVPIDANLGVPVVGFEVGGRAARAFLDTAAPLSFVDADVAARGVRVGSTEAFYPGFGRFATEIFRLPIQLAGRTLEISCGILPEMLQGALRLTGTEWILGADLFRDGPVAFDLAGGEVHFR